MVDVLIQEYVDQFERNFKGDSKYTKHLREMDAIKLNYITEKDTLDIIKPYLYYDWGKMNRVLGQRKFSGWETNITQQIKSNHVLLDFFKQRNLYDSLLDELDTKIKQCYQSLFVVVGKIASAKVLHLLCPAFFPAWDNPIANAVSNEKLFISHRYIYQTRKPILTKSIDEMTHEEKSTAYTDIMQRKEEKMLRKSIEEYYNFMKAVQRFINNHTEVLSSLATKYNKSILKISDECFWWGATHRPLYMFFNPNLSKE